MGRKLKPKRLSDREVIESYIRSDIDKNDVDQLLDDFAWFAMLSPYTQLGQLCAEVWKEIGSTVCRGELTEQVRSVIGVYGWPKGNWTRQKMQFRKIKNKEIGELIDFANAGRS